MNEALEMLKRYCDWHLSKGVQKQDEQVYCDACEVISRAAPAEWTNVYVEELWEQGGSIKVRDAHNAAIVSREDLIDNIMGDLVRETNIFPNQVQRAKELIRERLSVKKKVMDAGLKKVEK